MLMKNNNSVLKKLSRLFDKIIILPITKVIVFIGDMLSDNSKRLEKWFNNTSTLIIISLLLATFLYFFVNQEAIDLLENSADVLYDQPVTSVYNEEAYVIEGLPESVDITLIGRSSDLYLAKQIGVNGVTIDLTSLTPGTHTVDLKYDQAISSIDYKLDPSTATVNIYPKVSELKTLAVDILNQDNLDQTLIIDEINVERDSVIIKGAEHELSQVATVKALVDINNLSDPGEGTLSLEDIPLIAYDQNGEAVDIEIVPSKISAEVVISSPSKVVSVKIVPEGDVSFGNAITSVSSDVNNVQIYAPTDVLEGIDEIIVPIDVSELDENKEYNITMETPLGVNYMTINNVTVNVILGVESTRELENINIEYEGLTDGYTVQALSADYSSVTVALHGVEEVINTIDSSMVRAYVDLTQLTPGEHEVNVIVTGTDSKVEYTSKIKTIKILISE